MVFTECIKVAGYRLALTIFTEIHGEKFTEGFSFEEWIAVVGAMHGSSERTDAVLSNDIVNGKMVPLAKTYEQWEYILFNGSFGHKAEDKIRIRCAMFAALASMKECRRFHALNKGHIEEDFTLLIAERATHHALTFDDWAWIQGLVHATPGQVVDLVDLCFSNMEFLAGTFEEWLIIRERTRSPYNPRPEIQKRAFDKLVEFAR